MTRHSAASSSFWLPCLIAWLALGSLALLLTPLTAWTASMGWAPALWLVVAPLLMLLVAEPRLLLMLLAAGLRRRMNQRRATVFNQYGRRCADVPCAAEIRA